MKVVSLFSGAGGLDLGFIQAGNRVIWANDIYSDAAIPPRIVLPNFTNRDFLKWRWNNYNGV
jgi:hypothetical protein